MTSSAALMKTELSHAGYVVLDARDAASAFQIARTAHPDVITVDLLMPGMDGWSFIDRLRQEDGLADIPIVVVSGAPDAKTNARLPIDVSVDREGRGGRPPAARDRPDARRTPRCDDPRRRR